MFKRMRAVWKRIVHGRPDEVLDHVPVNRKSSDRWRKKKLAEAAIRHGKSFRCAAEGMHYEVIHRVTSPSDALEKIEKAARARQVSADVQPMRKKMVR